jgi:methyl-accepting chemotaxis protein
MKGISEFYHKQEGASVRVNNETENVKKIEGEVSSLLYELKRSIADIENDIELINENVRYNAASAEELASQMAGVKEMAVKLSDEVNFFILK